MPEDDANRHVPYEEDVEDVESVTDPPANMQSLSLKQSPPVNDVRVQARWPSADC